MSNYLIRHAKAGDRELWTRPDMLRPLTKPGLRQADGLVEQLAQEEIKRVLSSAYVRCVETVEPLAENRGLDVELHDGLAEGASLASTLALLEELGDAGAALCSHGDVMWNVIDDLDRRAVPGADATKLKKGSTWVLHYEGAEIARAAYLSPPG